MWQYGLNPHSHPSYEFQQPQSSGIDQGNCRRSIAFPVLLTLLPAGRLFMRRWRAIPGGFLSLQDIAGFALNAEVPDRLQPTAYTPDQF
jgi:hypothetical protein